MLRSMQHSKVFNSSFTLKVRSSLSLIMLCSLESQYTKEWERRVFKLIGDYLMRLNISIHNCFSMIDTDDSQTISMTEL